MPEPVVIIGPPSGPGGPVVRGNSDPEAAAPEAEADEAPETVAGPSVGQRILGFVLSLLGRAVKAIATVFAYLIREYPRHSIAACASMVILGAILYSQSGSGTGRLGVTNSIPGNASLQPPVSKLPGSEPKSEVATAPAPAPKSAVSEQVTATGDNPTKPPAPESKETKDAKTDLASQSNPPGPTGETAVPAPAPAPAATGELAKTGAGEKTPVGGEPAGAPSSSSPDPADVPLPPPASDSANATLMAENLAPAPAPAGDQATKTKATPDVPPDLWLPEGAPKTGADDATKAAKTGETAIAAAPNAEIKPPGEPKNAAESASKPVTPSEAPAGESNPAVTIPAPAAPGPVAQAPPDAKAGATNEVKMPGPEKGVEPPIIVPQGDSTAERDKKPTTTGTESAPKPADSSAPPPAPADSGARPPTPADSSAPPPAPAAEAPISPGEKAPSISEITPMPGEKASGNAAGPDAQSSPAPAPAPAKEAPVPASSPPPERGKERVADAETVVPAPTSAEPKAEAIASKKLPKAGWIVIPNSGKVPVDPTEGAIEASGGSGALEGSEPGNSAIKLGAHSARDVAFEPEPSVSRGNRQPAVDVSAGAGRGAPRPAGAPEPRAASHSERVDATEHLVESGENYWTISRQYYGNGRYYRALWKANERKYPNIKVLHVNDVIIVPAIQDLEPDLIDPPSASGRSDSLGTAGPSRPRSQKTRPDDEAVSAEQPLKRKDASASGVFDANVDETESRTSARPRPGGTAPGRPGYRVRAGDTLRSIARDTLGSARRADEILDLNRGLVDDPKQLVVGQVLELPEDARTSIRRPGRR